MAGRPIFVPSGAGGPFVREVLLEFKWHPGFALTQKRKNIEALHRQAEKEGIYPVLEISSKSEEQLGRDLSAFNLLLRFKGGRTLTVEQAFQGSKVFEGGGPFTDFFEMSGKDIKKDPRLRGSGKLVGFDLMGMRWDTEPLTAFYDWLYIHALDQSPGLGARVTDYAGFSDIAFNPQKSINCQARSAALYVSLYKRGLLEMSLLGKNAYLQTIGAGNTPSTGAELEDRAGEPNRREPGVQFDLFA